LRTNRDGYNFELHYATLDARVVKLVDTADLKSAAFVNSGRTGSIPVSGTNPFLNVRGTFKKGLGQIQIDPKTASSYAL
jgi:hypothetical protein